MDRRVKERLVGATILVVLIVLIVPELLSGPKRAVSQPVADPAGAVRNVTVDLATRKTTPADAPALAASAAAASDDGAQDSGVTSSRRGAAPTVTPLQVQQSAAAAADTAPAAAGSPAPGVPGNSMPATAEAGVSHASPADGMHRNWAVQLGSFASHANAEKLQRLLRTQRFAAFISSSGAGKTLRYRVRVGPLADRAGAERTIARLRKEGLSATAIPL